MDFLSKHLHARWYGICKVIHLLALDKAGEAQRLRLLALGIVGYVELLRILPGRTLTNSNLARLRSGVPHRVHIHDYIRLRSD